MICTTINSSSSKIVSSPAICQPSNINHKLSYNRCCIVIVMLHYIGTHEIHYFYNLIVIAAWCVLCNYIVVDNVSYIFENL